MIAPSDAVSLRLQQHEPEHRNQNAGSEDDIGATGEKLSAARV
jgi:hypothetical protein